MSNRKQILGVNVDFDLSYDDVIAQLDRLLQDKVTGSYVCTTNPEFIMDAQVDEEFRKIINKAVLSVPDGVGLLYANAFLNKISAIPYANKYAYALRTFFLGVHLGLFGNKNSRELSGTITGVELTNRLAALSAKKNYTMFLLGGSYGKHGSAGDMATNAAKRLSLMFPGVNIIGATSQFRRDPVDDSATLSYIHNVMLDKGVSNIDVVLVAYNHGFQDKWIARNAHKIPATLCMGVGRTFALLSGYQSKEPDFVSKANLSWLYRLFIQPSRLGRIYKAFPSFPVKLYLSCQKSPIK